MIIQEQKILKKLERNKRKIKKSKILEIPQREKAIEQAVNNLNSGEILVVAGKGHENIQDYGKSKDFFDTNIILKSIKKKIKNYQIILN